MLRGGSAGFPTVSHRGQNPNMISVIASEHRLDLPACVRSRVAETAVDAAESAQAGNSLGKMLCHQMAGAHRAAMRLIARSLNTSLPPVEMARLSNAEGGQAVIAANMKSGAGAVMIARAWVEKMGNIPHESWTCMAQEREPGWRPSQGSSLWGPEPARNPLLVSCYG